MRKFAVPMTVIPGARFARGERGELLYADATIKERAGSPLSIQKAGAPVVIMPKPISWALHFRNAAAKLRAMENQRAANPDMVVTEPDIRFASPKDIVRVPIYAGLDNRIAGPMKAKIRRAYEKRPDRKAA